MIQHSSSWDKTGADVWVVSEVEDRLFLRLDWASVELSLASDHDAWPEIGVLVELREGLKVFETLCEVVVVRMLEELCGSEAELEALTTGPDAETWVVETVEPVGCERVEDTLLATLSREVTEELWGESTEDEELRAPS
jgi:hypothetical protein